MQVFEKTKDPLTGLVTTMGSEDGKFVIQYEQDVAPSLDHALALRNDTDYSKAGIDKGFWQCVHIPDAALLKMKMEDGFDGWAASARELRQFLSKNKAKYGNLFTTGGKF